MFSYALAVGGSAHTIQNIVGNVGDSSTIDTAGVLPVHHGKKILWECLFNMFSYALAVGGVLTQYRILSEM
jgi:hypothetical protein